MSEPPRLRGFGEFLATIEDGDLHGRLSDTLREVLGRLREIAHNGNGRASGALTLQLSFSVDHGTVDIVSKVATKLPDVRPARTVLWLTEDGGFSRRNPDQPELPLRDALAGAGTIRTVS